MKSFELEFERMLKRLLYFLIESKNLKNYLLFKKSSLIILLKQIIKYYVLFYYLFFLKKQCDICLTFCDVIHDQKNRFIYNFKRIVMSHSRNQNLNSSSSPVKKTCLKPELTNLSVSELKNLNLLYEKKQIDAYLQKIKDLSQEGCYFNPETQQKIQRFS